MAQLNGVQVYLHFKNTLLDAINNAEGGWAAASPYGLQGPVVRQGVTYFPGRAAAGALLDNMFENWIASGRPGDFLSFLQSRWAPIGASNDPGNLNANWLGNVLSFLRAHGLSVGGGSAAPAPTAPSTGPGAPIPAPPAQLAPGALKVIVYAAGAVLLLYGLYGIATHRAPRLVKVG